ncbi:unnamed protein product [Brassica napus]|uniref:(rape) hypothetical protein n=1 Tax=Brassica napus TaxID=3708 RepID=A0A816YRK4_BRANA|nr:unnamed protein product [Brassica napus]
MEKKFDKKFTWVIKDFSSLQSVNILSDTFVVRGCKWQLNAYPKGNKGQNFLSLFLEVACCGSLPSGWRRHARFRLIVVNQRSETLSRQLEGQNWFEEKANGWGFQSMLSLDEINAKDSGFLVNGELKIVVEIELLEVIGKVDVNGFHFLSSQVEFVSRMFEKHPETASEVHLKNPNLRTVSMGKQFNKKITWVIKNFSSLKSEKFCSDRFVADGCKWYLSAYPKGSNDHLSLFLEVDNSGLLPIGWRRHTKFSFTVLNQRSKKLSRKHELQQWFEQMTPGWGPPSMLPLNELHAKDSGFLVNGDLKIVVEIDVLEVIGKLDVTEETSTIIETMDVNGFQILPSHAEYVSRMFERHSELASEFRPKNPNLRTAYISFLLSVIETMCQSPQELSQDDLTDAYAAMGFMSDAGFKLDWLEKKLDEVSEKKKNEKSSEAGLQEMEEDLRDLKRKCSDMEAVVQKEKEELKDLKQKCSNLEAELEKEKADVSVARAPLSFDDVV